MGYIPHWPQRKHSMGLYTPMFHLYFNAQCKGSVGALGDWTPREAYQPGARTTCQAPYLFATRSKWFQLDDMNGVANGVSSTTWMVSMKCHGGKCLQVKVRYDTEKMIHHCKVDDDMVQSVHPIWKIAPTQQWQTWLRTITWCQEYVRSGRLPK